MTSPNTQTALTAAELGALDTIRNLLLQSPAKSFTPAEVAPAVGLDAAQAGRCLDYLAALEREFDSPPRLRGVAKVLLQGQPFYEALSDNPDVRRDYDYRATNEGGRDFCPKNMFYYLWAWINLVERKCREQSIPNNRTILLTHDCRFYPAEIVAAARQAALLRGYQVVNAFTEGRAPSCVSSYSHAVRMAKPVLAVFITASHVSRPPENTVIGAKVSILGATGRLDSLATRDIKAATARELESLKSSAQLAQLVQPTSQLEDIDVSASHTRLATVSVLAALGKIPGLSVHDLAQQLKTAPDIDAALRRLEPAHIPALFQGLRVVVEGAHTSSGPLADRAFRALGAQTFLLHGEVKSIHGLHTADPSITQNLAALFEAMTAQAAHLGIAFDLDGDRGAIILRRADGEFTVLAPDKLGQVMMPFLIREGGYSQAAKPMHVRDCLSTDALLDEGRRSGIRVETTDAGYVFLKKREALMARDGYLTMSMGEASGHVWLDVTGPFENPIVLAMLFTAMGVQDLAAQGRLAPGQPIPATAIGDVFDQRAIPYRKSTRFQPLFAPALVAEAAQLPGNDTGWTPASQAPIPQKVVTLCRSASVQKLMAFFTEGRTFATPLGELKVARFETDWDTEENIYRFGKIYFSLNGVAAGSFVSRGSSNDPAAVQVWEVKEFGGETWDGIKLPETVIQQRFDLVGGLVLATCRDLGILDLADRKPAANMAGVLPSVARYEAMMR